MAEPRLSYNDKKRALQAEQDSRSMQQDMEAILFPVKAAQGVLAVTQMKQQVDSATIAADQQRKALDDQNATERGYADQYNREHGTQLGAAEVKGRLQAVFDLDRSKTHDVLFQHDQVVAAERLKEDARAMLASGIATDEWQTLPPEQQRQLRFDAQFSALRGKGMTDAELTGVKVGDRTVGDLLADGNNYTSRGTLKPKAFGDIAVAHEEAVKAREDARKVVQTGKLAEASETTTTKKLRTEYFHDQKTTENEARLLAQWRATKGKMVEVMTPDEQAVEFARWKAVMAPGTGPVPATPAKAPGGLSVDALFPKKK